MAEIKEQFNKEEEEIRAVLRKDAEAADRLINNPIIQRFLEDQRKRALKALKALPYEAEHSALMALKIYLNQLDDFENHLRAFINKYNDYERNREFRDSQL